jgi:hypothetical protein
MAATLLTTAPVLGLTPTDLGSIVDELHAYHAIFSLPACPARAAGVAGHLSLQGLLLDIPCTSIEPVMLHLCGADRNAVRTLQSFVSISARDDAPILV